MTDEEKIRHRNKRGEDWCGGGGEEEEEEEEEALVSLKCHEWLLEPEETLSGPIGCRGPSFPSPPESEPNGCAFVFCFFFFTPALGNAVACGGVQEKRCFGPENRVHWR